MKRATKRNLARSWGYLLLAFVVYAWFGTSLGPGFIAALSGAVVIFMFFQAPVWCCAETRKGEYCRNNAWGILMGCHLKQHKWQKFRMAFRDQAWSKLLGRILSGIGGQAAALSAFAGSISAVVATTTLLIK